MPSASAKSSQSQAQFNMSDLLQEPLKGAVSVMEKKLRNLEKRKLKLYEYQKKLKQGSDLSDEQKKAAENLILVENSLETVKELHKLMVAMEQEYAKASKKEAKRLKQESLNQVEAKAVEAARKVIHIQAVLGLLSEDVKLAFLAGSDGACRLSAEDFLKLDQVYELVNPTEQDDGQKLSDIVSSCSTHLIGLIEEKDKEIFNGTTYRDVSDLIKKVANSGYFDKCARTGEKDEEAGSVAVKEEAAARPVSTGCESPVDSGSSGHSSHADPEEAQQGYYQEQSAQHTAEAAHFVNGLGGVDLPPEVEDHPGDYDDDGIDFMGESEIVTTSTVRLEAAPESAHRDDQPPPSLNAGSPEFIPRSMQAIPDTADYLDADSLEVAHPVADAEAENLSEQAAADSGWQNVTSQSQHHTGGFRGGRGRGGRGTFNRGGGRGRGSRGGGYQDRGSREGGEHRGNREGGEYRGNRDGGEYRGNREGGEYRGGRQDGGGFQRARGSGGGFRGNRGTRGGSGGERNFRGGSRGSSRGGGFGRPQQPQAQP